MKILIDHLKFSNKSENTHEKIMFIIWNSYENDSYDLISKILIMNYELTWTTMIQKNDNHDEWKQLILKRNFD